MLILVKITLHALMEKRKEVIQTLLSMIETVKKEHGCLSCHVFQHIEVQNDFSVWGEWNNCDDLDRYIKSASFGVLLGTRSLLSESLSIQIHTVSKSEGMERVNSLRGTIAH